MEHFRQKIQLSVIVDDNSISLGDGSKWAGNDCARHVILEGKRGRYQHFIAYKINKNVDRYIVWAVHIKTQ
jgi:hypothetical protein